MWAGRPCFIVGGGPSLKGFDFSTLKGALTIGINRAFEFFDPTIVFSMDARFWNWIEEGAFGSDIQRRFQTYDKGLKVFMNFGGFYPEDIIALPGATERKAWATSIDQPLGNGNNSGYSALNLAYVLGANPIYLLGFDMHGSAGVQTWYHGGYPETQQEDVYDTFRRSFESIAPRLEAENFTVFNLCPTSALNCFTKAPFSPMLVQDTPAVVAYYTPNGYEKYAYRLIESLKPWGLETDIVCVPTFNSWQEATHFKPHFISTMLGRHKKPIIYVDADATIERFPHVLCSMGKADVGVHYRMGKELLSGTLYFAYTTASRTILNSWIQMNDQNPRKWDQWNLQVVLDEYRGSAVVKRLPAEYCAIFDSMPEAGENPAIVHWQASRRLR